MSTRNLVSVDIPDADITKVKDALKLVVDTLGPYVIALTPEDRRTMLKMGDGTEPFVEKTMDYVASNPQFLPSVVSAVEMGKDWKVISQLTPILRTVEQLQSNLNDTIMESGSELYADCLGYYGGVQFGVKMNIPDAKPIDEDLGRRFKGQGRRKKPNGGN
ncbi:hypothetical protein J0A67_08085 [Algoriphagus aestuariicola]|jgi:hypothetical protein|uniref:Uncharacterized protein n=1 Tax=Algoriphagus aestuariicola TaxID=1852016 RepID=A0ABS3BNC6_9BACT|nr:hypothetical protein [Algoriphagus aestuariicola]MBN7800815.1 hypothetical protein [Algoriphagus aestuariicola]